MLCKIDKQADIETISIVAAAGELIYTFRVAPMSVLRALSCVRSRDWMECA
jgi:hypothetical protein